MIWRVLCTSFLAVLLGGCVVGTSIDYESEIPHLNIQSERQVVVGVQDVRPYVLSGAKTKDFVGLQRAGLGNPWDVTTKSGNPLALDMASTIVKAMKNEGINAQPIVIASDSSDDDTIQTLLKAGAGKYLLVSLKEWKVDTYVNAAMIYNAKARVFNKDGELLAENSISGNDDLGGNFVDPVSHVATAVPIAYKKNIETLLRHKDIARALE